MNKDNISSVDDLPSYVKNRVDVKGANIFAIANAIDSLKKDDKIKLDKNTKVTLLTSSAMIIGEVIMQSDDDKTSDIGLIINTTFKKALNYVLKNDEKKNTFAVNNTCYVPLKNAVIMPFSNPNQKSSFSILNVFTDQILGFSYGVMNLEKKD